MALAGLWAGGVPGLVGIDIADFGRRYMASDRPSAWLMGSVSHLINRARDIGVENGSSSICDHRLPLAHFVGCGDRNGVRAAMIGQVRVSQPIMVLHGGGSALACGLDGQIRTEGRHGLFVGDTRVLSTYRMWVSGVPWHLLGRSRSGQATAHWEFHNSTIRDPSGDIPEGRVLFSLHRRIDGVLHDDLQVSAFHDRPIKARLTIQPDADFADIFEVKQQSIPPRLMVLRNLGLCGGSLAYEREGFRRALYLTCTPACSQPVYVGAQVVFDLDLSHGQEWRCCLELAPEIDGRSGFERPSCWSVRSRGGERISTRWPSRTPRIRPMS